MKNWIIVLLIFVIPLGLYAYLERTTNDAAVASVSNDVKLAKAKMIKFFSPMCSDCKKVSKEMVTVVPLYKDAVEIQEINVSENTKENKEAIKKYNVTVVPTMIFIDKNGKITKKEGYLTKETITENLEKIK